jgi:YVTN family beta-propeller protein
MRYPSLFASVAIAGALTALTAFAAAPTYKVQTKIKIGGQPRWDYVFVDSTNHKLYISHGTQTEVVDTNTDKLIATIPDTKGVHGIAVALDLGKGYISNGQSNDVTIFDLKTSKATGNVKTGANPDSIIYEPTTHRVLTFNGRSNDITIFDAKTGDVITAALPVGGKPEFSQVDGKGHVFANIEDKNEIVIIDAKQGIITKRFSISPCDGPSGLAYDPGKGRLFSVCNKVMAISDATAGKLITTVAIGQGPDGVALDDGYAFSANGRDGNISMVGETAPGKFEVVATIPTEAGARTIGADQKAHKLYLPAAEYGPADQKGGRGAALADSFHIVVVGR